MVLTPFVREVTASLTGSWRSLVATDLLFKLFAFSILTPLFSVFWQGLLLVVGGGILSDADIARFFLGPFGWICGITVGAAWLAILAMEQGSLLYLLASRSDVERAHSTFAIHFAIRNAVGVFSVAARMIGWLLIATLPFLLIAGACYIMLLREYDINYYLKEWPSEFIFALVVACILGIVWLAVLLRLLSSWFLALPLVLFHQERGNDALRTSRRLIEGHRHRILIWLLLWFGFVLLSNLFFTTLVGVIGGWLIPEDVSSIYTLAFQVGVLVLLLAGSGLLVNLAAAIAGAGVLFHAYRQFVPKAELAMNKRLIEDGSRSEKKLDLLTRPRLIAGLLILCLCAGLIGFYSLDSIRLEDDVQVMAHRGASKTAPENTMAAFRQAIEDGADWIEIDVQETADGVVVIAHDSDFMKVAGNPIKVWNAKLSDLSNIDIGGWFDPQFVDQRVPTLADVLRLCKDKVGVIIELKYYGHDEQLEQRVVEIVEAEEMVDQVMVMSLKAEGIKKLKALRPTWRCGLLLSVYVGNLKKVDADFLAINASFATRDFVRRAHKLDKDVYVWTVNDSATISKVLNRNVDGILTDRPRLARDVLRERSEMSSAERLLAELSLLLDQTPPEIGEP
ncbi:MAG: glycerophosphodiester phosphodiesterase [Planctomycetota bacterium]